jgi:hypothetical protein
MVCPTAIALKGIALLFGGLMTSMLQQPSTARPTGHVAISKLGRLDVNRFYPKTPLS